MQEIDCMRKTSCGSLLYSSASCHSAFCLLFLATGTVRNHRSDADGEPRCGRGVWAAAKTLYYKQGQAQGRHRHRSCESRDRRRSFSWRYIYVDVGQCYDCRQLHLERHQRHELPRSLQRALTWTWSDAGAVGLLCSAWCNVLLLLRFHPHEIVRSRRCGMRQNDKRD